MPFAFSIAFAPAFDGAINYSDIIVPDIENPYIGMHVISDIDSRDLIIAQILRYNGSGRFTSVLIDNISYTVTLDVYYNSTLLAWRAKKYIPERYRDEDGVNKAL